MRSLASPITQTSRSDYLRTPLIHFLNRALVWLRHRSAQQQIGLVVAALVVAWSGFHPAWDSRFAQQAAVRSPLSQPASAQPSMTELLPIPPRTTFPEIRGVWMTNVASSVLFSPWGIPRAMNQLREMNFNTVYPVVWNRGKAFYHSATLKKITGQSIDPLLALAHPIKDPLQEMVQLGHQHNIRVMPWFEYGFMVPMNAAIAQQHPDWLTTRKNGSRWLEKGTFEDIELPPEPAYRSADKSARSIDPNAPQSNAPQSNAPQLDESNQSFEEAPPSANSNTASILSNLLKSGAPKHLGWLNPLHPAVQELLLQMMEEVVSQYDVDGIQLDDHFSWPVEFGYDLYTIALYQSEHQGQLPPDNSADADWVRWRADKLSGFIRVMHARLKAKCPTCALSLSPNPAKFAYRFHLQDWRRWVAAGWVDELVVQVYRDNQRQFEGELGKAPLQAARDRIPVSIGILTGTWKHPVAFEQIRAQVKSSRDYHFSGISFFYWDTLWSYFTPEAPRQRRQNFQQLMSSDDASS